MYLWHHLLHKMFKHVKILEPPVADGERCCEEAKHEKRLSPCLISDVVFYGVRQEQGELEKDLWSDEGEQNKAVGGLSCQKQIPSNRELCDVDGANADPLGRFDPKRNRE
eukprot:TRINITY_DN1265_c0_g3_i1.p1 TRINITY_DN1265_c0_g3~~TRINITY_DN1265_c0_g3_i1.p1  ORF type:complete len:110 (+),score=2.78 TRINITY_DN1265_c0_g3_i1:241-570(+)